MNDGVPGDRPGVLIINLGDGRSDDLIGLVAPYLHVSTASLFRLNPGAVAPALAYVLDLPFDDRSILNAIRTLIEDPAFANAPKVCILPSQSRKLMLRVHELGAADYFVRPVPPTPFAETMAQIINGAVEASWERLGETARAALKISLRAFDDCFAAARDGHPPPLEDVKESSRLVVRVVGEGGVDACLEAVRGHHNATFRHSILMATLLVSFGRRIGIGDADLQKLAIGGLLHDIGKARVPAEILDKAEPLDDEEWLTMGMHPETAYTVLAKVDGLDPDILAMVRLHHERLDGTGYPLGLSAADIPDIVRMTSIVDAYAHMVDPTAYRPALAHVDAIGALAADPGYDQDLVGAFAASIST